jgi:hypothetical protein
MTHGGRNNMAPSKQAYAHRRWLVKSGRASWLRRQTSVDEAIARGGLGSVTT